MKFIKKLLFPLLLAASLVASAVADTPRAPFYDRVAVFSNTVGTGTLTLGAAYSADYFTFSSSGVTNGSIVRYVIVDGTVGAEIGHGTYSTSGSTLTRALDRSTTGSLLNLDGNEVVYLTPSSDDTNSLYGQVVAGTTQTITATQWLKGTIFVVTTSGQNLTLPVSTTLAPNSGIIIQTIGQSVTLTPNAADSINSGTAGASVTVNQNVSSIITTDGAGNIHATPLTGAGGSPGGSTNAIQKNGGGGTFVASSCTDNGTIVSCSEPINAQANSFVREVANAGTTGTTLNKLAKLTGAPSTAVIAGTSDTDGIIGIVIGGAGTTSNAQIARDGLAGCVFDGATTAGDFVTISSTTAGDCHDVGVSRPTTSQTIGRVLSTNGSGGTYVVDLSLGYTNASGGGSGTVNNCSTTGSIAYYATTGTAVSCPGTNPLLMQSVEGAENVQSGTTYTLVQSDCGKTVAFTNASAVTVTIPASIVPVAGTSCVIAIRQDGSGQVSVNGTAVTAATLVSAHSYTKTFGVHAVIGLDLTTISSSATAVFTGDGA